MKRPNNKVSYLLTKDDKVQVHFHVNDNIKIGDNVKLFDGSAVTYIEPTLETIYIVNAYSELTGTYDILKNIVGKVIEVNIRNKVVPSGIDDYMYGQDIVVQLGIGLFRTCSQFVALVEPF